MCPFLNRRLKPELSDFAKDQRYAGPVPTPGSGAHIDGSILVDGIGSSRRKKMNPSTKDEIKGNIHAVKGKVKETAGQVTNNPDLEAEGKAERTAGKIEKKVGQIEKVLGK